MDTENIAIDDEELESTKLGPRTTGEVWKDWSKASVKYVWSKIHSPFGVYLVSTWLASFLIMCTTNTFRGGAFFDGPYYWIDVFLTYGLSIDQPTDIRLISKPFIVWFMAPVVILLMGFTLFTLTSSGFFRNGALPQRENDFLYQSEFFSKPNIWGSEVINADNPKWTKTYIWIVIMPLVIGALFAAFYNFIVFKMIKKKKYLPSPKKFLIVIALFSIVVGIEKALVTGDINIYFKETFFSLFVDRRENAFLSYNGQYHPFALALTMWLLYLIPFFASYLIFLIVGNLDNIWKNRTYFFKKIKGFIEARKQPVELQEK